MPMTGIQRVQAALAGRPADCVPVVPEIIQHALNISGARHREYSTDPQVMADTILAAQRRYDYDAVYVSTDNYILAEAFGAPVNFPDDDPPQLLAHPLSGGYDQPLKPFSTGNGRLPVILEATRLCREAVGDRIFIKTNIDSAPFSAAACLRGPQDFLMDLYDEEDEHVLPLLQSCTDAIVAYGQAAARAGAHGLAFGDSVASLISREHFLRYVLPYAQQAVSRLHGTGLPVFYHICGNTTHLLDLVMEIGADCVELDSMVSMEQAKQTAKGRCALEGNISTIQALYEGTPADVAREADALLELFGRQGGFILSSACEVPRNTPGENLMEITRSARRFHYAEKESCRE